MTEDQLKITYVEFGPGSSGDTINVDRSTHFFDEETGQSHPIRRISCSNPMCTMNQENSARSDRGYSIESLISEVIGTEEPIRGKRINCSGREGRTGPSCNNYIEVTIEIEG